MIAIFKEDYTMARFEYPVLLTPADEGGFVVTCRDLPEIITQGENIKDALDQAADAMEEAFSARIAGGLTVPHPSKTRRNEKIVSPPVEMVIKAALYVTMKEAGVSKVELAKRMGVDEKSIRRMLDPHHASKLPGITDAIGKLGMRLRVDIAPYHY
jgi:antitoxin HicB